MKLFIVGDSTASIKSDESRPESGWGEYLHLFLPNDVKICNHALNGRSSKSFIKQGHLKEIEQTIKQGDLLLIQFGHNDQKSEDPDRFTEPDFEYPKMIEQYILLARSKHATPILLSSMTRRNFIDSHQLNHPTVGIYPQKMKQIASLHGCCFIDVYRLSTQVFESLGDELSKDYFMHLSSGDYPSYPNGIMDNTHLNSKGALTIASVIAMALIKNNLFTKE
jgi:lysophospholipase L1-like esterase